MFTVCVFGDHGKMEENLIVHMQKWHATLTTNRTFLEDEKQVIM